MKPNSDERKIKSDQDKEFEESLRKDQEKVRIFKINKKITNNYQESKLLQEQRKQMKIQSEKQVK